MKCQILVDWLTFSVKLKFSNILVCYEPREDGCFQDMGVCVSMSGNGCRTFETLSKLSGQKQGLESSAFPALFRLLAAEEGANISRIDIACDDREGYLNMDEIVQKIQSNEVNSRMAKRSVIVSYDGARRGEPRSIWARPRLIFGCAFMARPRTPKNGFQISKKRSFQTIIISNFPAFVPGDFVMLRGNARD